ncbi:MAG TPA: hypothetical protein VF388_01845 [Lacunisphaera sp.]
MKRLLAWTGMFGMVAVLLLSSGCIAIATAPIRMAQREKAEQAFDRIADRTPEQIAAFLDQRLAEKLALTDEQKPKVAALDLDYARKLRATAASDDGVRAKGRAMKKENEAHEAALKEVLTPDQFSRFTAMQEELREALRNAAAK